ncbi:MAG TPA: serine/threonine-protein kinase [Candidatus Acidoferrales bacterium]|nr:serine/threonine-protein kinase [Candidatus Acidoferrales bacterium]
MNQPSDPRGSNGTDRRAPAVDSPRGSRSQQDTILLSDVPEAEALIASSQDTASQGAPVNLAALHLSSAAIAALGQRYDVLDAAGHGSMGNVYKARDRETGEVVALKLLKPEIASDQQMMDRFKNELLFARKITHKNICRVHEFNRLGGIAYTSMEFIEGESLRSVLTRFGAMSLRKGIDLAQQMCSGLKEAHAQGIVHRDLKPENVMIDLRGNVKIMDFGIARSMESLTRMTGAMVGTPAYMAPEQVAGKPVDYRTDIYSLGLILYEVFTGTQAFTADNAVAVAMKQLNDSPVPPREIEPGIPVPIERAILRCLEKEPGKRFQSIAEMEKVFSSSALSTPPSPGSSTTAGRATQDAIALQPAIALPPEAPVIRATARPRPSRGKSVAAAVSFAVIVLFAAGAAKWAQKAQLADKLLPPAAPTAPKLPNFALKNPAPDPLSAAPASQSASPAPSAASVSTSTQLQRSMPAASVSATSSEPDQNLASSAAQPMGSVLRGNAPSFIWVARFDREDRAQDASRKIQGLGLTSVVVPRRMEGGKKGFIVLSGPFPPSRIPSVIDWLRTQGFQSVREVKVPAGALRGRNPALDTTNNFDGSTE